MNTIIDAVLGFLVFLAVGLASWLAFVFVGQMQMGLGWQSFAAVLVAVLVGLIAFEISKFRGAFVKDSATSLGVFVLIAMAVVALIGAMVSGWQPADSNPLPYFFLLNPADIAALMAWLMMTVAVVIAAQRWSSDWVMTVASWTRLVVTVVIGAQIGLRAGHFQFGGEFALATLAYGLSGMFMVLLVIVLVGLGAWLVARGSAAQH